jgi:hypothetical protein
MSPLLPSSSSRPLPPSHHFLASGGQPDPLGKQKGSLPALLKGLPTAYKIPFHFSCGDHQCHPDAFHPQHRCSKTSFCQLGTNWAICRTLSFRVSSPTELPSLASRHSFLPALSSPPTISLFFNQIQVDLGRRPVFARDSFD